MREMRAVKAAAVKKSEKTMVAKRMVTSSSSSKCGRTPSPSPPPAGVSMDVDFDLGSLIPRKKRRILEDKEETEDE